METKTYFATTTSLIECYKGNGQGLYFNTLESAEAYVKKMTEDFKDPRDWHVETVVIERV